MAVDISAWKATPVYEVLGPDTVFFDTNVVSRIYQARQRSDHGSAWKKLFEAIPRSNRVVNEVVLWELRNANFSGDDWETWCRQQFQRVELDHAAVKRFRRLFENVFRPGLRMGGVADGLLAAHCMQPSDPWVLATDNIPDFCLIAGLRLLVRPPGAQAGEPISK